MTSDSEVGGGRLGSRHVMDERRADVRTGAVSEPAEVKGPEASMVAVAELDSVEQLRAWLIDGPQRAIQRYTAIIRTALLVADRVYVDRNQLLDGICLLALGPEGVARVLGLEEWQELPLVVGLEPLPDDPDVELVAKTVEKQLARVSSRSFCSAARTALALWQRVPVASVDGGLDADLLEIYSGTPVPTEPTEPVDHVEPGFLPIPQSRLRDFDAHSIVAARQEWAQALNLGRMEATAWPMLTDTSGKGFWEPGEIEPMPGPTAQAWARRLREWTEDLVRAGARTGEESLNCASGTSRDLVGRGSMVPPSVSAHSASEGRECQRNGSAQVRQRSTSSLPPALVTRGEVVRHLARMVRGEDQEAIPSPRGADASRLPDGDTHCRCPEDVVVGSGGSAEAAARADPSGLGSDTEQRRRHARAALRWWSQLYYDALLREHARLPGAEGRVARVGFADTGRPVQSPTLPSGGAPSLRGSRGGEDGGQVESVSAWSGEEGKVEVEWGLRIRRRSNWRIAVDRMVGHRLTLPESVSRALSGLLSDGRRLPAWLRRCLTGLDRRRGSAARQIRIEGEIIESLRALDPVSYRILRHNKVVREANIKRASNMRSWHNVALAVREAEQETIPWARRAAIAASRFGLLALAAVLLALRGEGQVFGGSSAFDVSVWVGVAILAGFPFDEAAELFSMRPAQMTSTIRLIERES